MKIMKLLFLLLFFCAVGGFAYFAFTDIDVEQKQVIKPISNDRFFDAG